MSEQTLKPGAFVQVSFAGEWIDDERGRAVYDPVSGWRYSVPNEAAVEVLEPADDPSKDPLGAVRPERETGASMVKVRPNGWVVVRDRDEVAAHWSDASVATVGGSVIGAVPGTPAAEQNPVPPPVLARVRELLTNGQRIRAIKAIREAAVGLGLKEAKAFAETLPEWAVAERVNNERLRDAVLGEEVHVPADPHVPVVLKRADTAPPISSYSQHLKHSERHLDCEFCRRQGDLLP